MTTTPRQRPGEIRWDSFAGAANAAIEKDTHYNHWRTKAAEWMECGPDHTRIAETAGRIAADRSRAIVANVASDGALARLCSQYGYTLQPQDKTT